MLKISDIMSTEVFSVSASAPVEEVAWELAVRNADGAPVTDHRGQLVGTVTRADLADPAQHARAAGRGAQCARDVMSPRVSVLKADQPAIEAVRILSEQPGRPLIVVGPRDEVVGTVTDMDVLEALGHGERFEPRKNTGGGHKPA